MKTETDQLSNVREYKYDNASNVNKTIDRLGRVRTFAYDRLNRMTKEEWFTNTSDVIPDRTMNYVFDREGQLTAVADSSLSVSQIGADYQYTYDNLGRVTKSTSDLFPLTTDLLVFQEFAYDAMSRRTEAKASYGGLLAGLAGATKDYKNTYSYDDLGRLNILTQRGQSGGNTVAEKYVDFDYNTIGQYTAITRYDDVDTPSNQIVASTYEYDNLARLKKLEHRDNGTLRAGYEWKHNGNGWLTEMNFTTGAWDAEDAAYAYDKNGQVLEAERTGTDEDYEYDLNGNRTKVGGTTWTVNSDNRINRDGTNEYTFDNEGNLTRRRTLVFNGSTWEPTGDYTDYAYDHRNRLTSVTDRNSGGTATKIVKYDYDPFDRRVNKYLDSDANGSPNRQEFYVWDGDDVVLDFVDADGGTLNPALDMRYLHGAAVDQVLAQETAGGTVRWMLADHQGTVRDLVDNAGAPTSNHVVFDSFGKITSGTLGTRFTYTGQEYDPDTGLYYSERPGTRATHCTFHCTLPGKLPSRCLSRAKSKTTNRKRQALKSRVMIHARGQHAMRIRMKTPPANVPSMRERIGGLPRGRPPMPKVARRSAVGSRRGTEGKHDMHGCGLAAFYAQRTPRANASEAADVRLTSQCDNSLSDIFRQPWPRLNNDGQA